MEARLIYLSLTLTVLNLLAGWIWWSGRWTRTQEIDLQQVAKTLQQMEARVDKAGQRMSDLSGELQVFTALAYRVEHLEQACADLPALREELITLRTVLRLRRQRNGTK